jgi:hypothetical protein
MFTTGLHPLRRDRPHGAVKIKLGPLRPKDFARSRGRENGKLERQRRGTLPGL